MVVAPDDTTGIEGQCVHAIMDGEGFDDTQGKWMKKTLYELMAHPQVRQ